MGVSMSITKNAKYTDPKYADKGQVDEEGADGAEAAAPALEANSETIDKIKQENFDKWSKIFRDLILGVKVFGELYLLSEKMLNLKKIREF